MGWSTVVLAVLWNVQAYIFGFGILALGAYLAVRAFRALGGAS